MCLTVGGQNMMINCAYCDAEFYRKPSQIKGSKNIFCSKTCKDEWQVGSINPSLHRRIEHHCHYCDELILVPRYKFNKYLNGDFKNLFCDKQCHDDWQRGNTAVENHPLSNRVVKNCEFCKSRYEVVKSKEDTSKYCSVDCRISGRVRRIEATCEYCNKNFTKKKSLMRESNFCCRECSAKWNSEFNNRQVLKNCMICNKEFKVQRDREDTAKSCSKSCHYKWLSEHYAQSEKGKEHYRKLGVNSILNQKYSETKPERIFKEFLIESGIEFIPQYLMYDKFIVDFYLPKENMVIEVFGDYWHGNPLFYGKKEGVKTLSEKQDKQKKKDRARQAYLEKCGHKFYILWEHDIYNNLSKTTKFLKK